MAGAGSQSFQHVGDLIGRSLEQASWAEKRRFVEAHPVLLTDLAQTVLASLRDYAFSNGEHSFAQTLEEERILLQRCRTGGTERAFRERVPEGPDAAYPEIATALALEDQYQADGDIRALEQAAALWDDLLARPGFSSSPAGRLAHELAGKVHLLRYHARHQRSDLDRALSLWEQAVKQTPPDSPFLPQRLNHLASGLRERWVVRGESGDLQEAMALWRHALDLMPQGSPDTSDVLHGLGNAMQDRALQTGSEDGLRQAVELYEAAIAAASGASHVVAKYLSSYASGLRALAGRLTDVHYLDRAEEAENQALSLLARTSPDRAAHLSHLGEILEQRYRLTDDRACLDAAVSAHEAASTASAGVPEAPTRLAALGTALHTRFLATGDTADIDHSVELHERAVAAVEKDHADAGEFLDGLGVALDARFSVSLDRADLDRAIEVLNEALRLARRHGRSPAARKGNLSNALGKRFVLDRNEADLDRSIALLEDLVGDEETAGNRAALLNNLGAVLRDRAAVKASRSDLDRAITLFEEAIAQEPATSPRGAGMLHNLASALRHRWPTSREQDLETRIADLSRRACQAGIRDAPASALTAARTWGDDAMERGALGEASEAYSYALDALHLLIETQLGRRGQKSWLRAAMDLPARAAVALSAGGHPEAAVMALEEGRALLLTESLDRRQDTLAALSAEHEDLRGRYLEAAARLSHLLSLDDAVGPQATMKPSISQEDGGHLAKTLRAAKAELEAVVAEVRAIPGWGQFLRRPQFRDIAWAEQQGSVVYLAAAPRGGVALVVQNDGAVEVCPLPGLRRARTTKPGDETVATLDAVVLRYLDEYGRARDGAAADAEWGETVDETAHWLGETVMKHLIPALVGTRLIIVPTGWLGFLPLHAAWWQADDPSRGRVEMVEHFVVTYAPNVRSLARGRDQRARLSSGRLLAVEEPQPTSLPPLTCASVEVRAAVGAFPQVTRLQGPEAGHDAVLAALPAATHVHFACHGYGVPNAPGESALLMADDVPLTLGEIFDLHLDLRLAVLSACETAVPGTELLDEVFSLPTGLLQAGTAGIIGSLWPVPDAPTMVLMARFYELWHGHHLGPPEALNGAQRWLRTITNEGVLEWLEGRSDLQPTPEQTGGFYAAALERPEAPAFPRLRDWAGFTYAGI